MTNRSDRRDRRSDSGDSRDEELSQPVKGSKAGPAQPEEHENIDSPLSIEEREQLTLDRSQDSLEVSTSPSVAVERTPLASTGRTTANLRRVSDTVDAGVRPKPPVKEHECPVSRHRIEVERIPEQSGGSQLRDETKTRGRGPRSLNQHKITVTRIPERINNESRPTTQTLIQSAGQQTVLEEVEDLDPIFGWSGGHPYTSDRPTLILHCAEEDDQIQSFAFLQRALRDTFTELEGGEPTAEQVEFVANEAQIPNVGGRIVTIDVTGNEWEPSLDNEAPSIERGGIDIVTTLTDQAETLYSGSLGYLVVNVPSAWESTFRRRNFIDRLVVELADAAPKTEGERDGAFEKLRTAPITVARPRIADPEDFAARVARYFGFDVTPDFETIAQIDESFVAGLRSDRWTKIALTERQSYGEESSRHYNWKALVTEGLARALWTSTTDREQLFETFVRQRLLPEGPVDTEYPLGGDAGEEDGLIADVHLNEDSQRVPDKFYDFFDDGPYTLPLAIEFETGFSEAAFGYRKLVESIEKYDAAGFDGTLIVVVPPRLLYRGESQARHLDRLVQLQGEQIDDLTTELCVPRLRESRCSGLQTASTLIKRLYDDV